MTALRHILLCFSVLFHFCVSESFLKVFVCIFEKLQMQVLRSLQEKFNNTSATIKRNKFAFSLNALQ